jgi:hypothetical protein
MFLDGTQLVLPKAEQDLYGAHEIAQLRSLVNKQHVYEAFLKANRWISRWLPHALIVQNSFSLHKTTRGIFKPVELINRQLQLMYMRRRKTAEKIHRYMLRFHPRDAREWVIKAYQEKLRILGS